MLRAAPWNANALSYPIMSRTNALGGAQGSPRVGREDLRALPKMKLNMDALEMRPYRRREFGISSPCDTVTHPRTLSAHLSRAFPGAAEFPRAAFRFSN